MHSGYCIACGSGLSIRREEGPLRLYACNRCIGGKEAVQCSQCHRTWFGRTTDACKRCLGDELASKGVYTEFKGARV